MFESLGYRQDEVDLAQQTRVLELVEGEFAEQDARAVIGIYQR